MSAAITLFVIAAIALAVYALKRKSKPGDPNDVMPEDVFPTRSTSDRDPWSNEPLDPP